MKILIEGFPEEVEAAMQHLQKIPGYIVVKGEEHRQIYVRGEVVVIKNTYKYLLKGRGSNGSAK